MSQLRVALVGARHDYTPVVVAHMHRQNLFEFAEIIAVSDEDDAQRARWVELAGGARDYPSWEDLLEREQVEIAVVSTSLAEHASVIGECMRRGVHVIVDKPLALNAAEAESLAQAAAETGTHLMVDIPTAWNPGMWAAKRLVDSGALGEVFYAKYRAANMGPTNIGCDPLFTEWLYAPESGGVTFDYVDYGAVFSLWFFGAPQSVVASGGNFASPHLEVDDNVTAILEYSDKRVLAEGSWTQIGAIPIDGPIILGTRGTLVVDYAVQHGEYGVESWQWNLKGVRMFLKGYSEWIDVPLETPVPGMRSGIDHLIHAIRSGADALYAPVSIDLHVEAQRIIDACLDALESGTRTPVAASATPAAGS